MLTINLDDFIIELKEGTVKHVGASTTSAEVKLYDIAQAETRTFGDQIKLQFKDDEGNCVELALESATVESMVEDIEDIR